MPFFISIFLPALLAVLLQTLILKGVATVFRAPSVTWAHCAVFAFSVTSVIVLLRVFDSHIDNEVGIVSAVVISALVHAAIGAGMFYKLPRGDRSTIGIPMAATMPVVSFALVSGLLILVVNAVA